MAKIRFILIGLLSLLFLVNTCSAAVDLTVTPVNGDTVAPGGTISYYVNVSATEDLGGLPQRENLSIEESTKQSGWSYVFNPETLILENKGDLNTSILTITVPANATIGETYHHVLLGDGYQTFDDVSGPLYINVENDESGFNTHIQVPEFPSVAVPVVAILGIIAVIGRRKE